VDVDVADHVAYLRPARPRPGGHLALADHLDALTRLPSLQPASGRAVHDRIESLAVDLEHRAEPEPQRLRIADEGGPTLV
jgi:hypothetical protein